MGIVLWIVIYVKLIHDLLAYVGGFHLQHTMVCSLHEVLSCETNMPLTWDKLDIPHECPKQLFGSHLMIINFDVDIDTMTITMPDYAHSGLIAAICDIANTGQRCAQVSKVGWLDELVA